MLMLDGFGVQDGVATPTAPAPKPVDDENGAWSIDEAGPILAVIAAGAAVLIVLLCGVTLCCCCCRKKKTVSADRMHSQNENMSNASAAPGSQSTAQASSIVKPMASPDPLPPSRPSKDVPNPTMSNPDTGNLTPNSMPPMYSMGLLSGYAFGSGMKLNAQDSVYSWADTSVGDGGAALATIPVMATSEYVSRGLN